MSEPVDDPRLDELIHVVDLDELIRLVDARTDDADWAGLHRIRTRCIAATVETGRQLWPAATLAEYRLALLAPPQWAATVLDGEAGRFTIGPLSEVVAVHHSWDELRDHLTPAPIATFVAHERAIRGEAIEPDDLDRLPPVLDIPAERQSWEPAYPRSNYLPDGAEHPEPGMTAAGTGASIGTARAEVVDDDTTDLAVRQLVEPWTTASTGRAESTCVEGDVSGALGALGVRSARIVEIDAGEAIAWLAWAGASGGAHGRRRGMAMGRFSAWWVLGAIGDLHDDWPPRPDDVGELLDDLQWYRWDAHEPAGGWRLQLAVEDRHEGLAWAINAADGDV